MNFSRTTIAHSYSEFRHWRVLEFAIVLVLLIAVADRLTYLYNVPGLNSDEAEWSNKMLALHLGEVWSWRTPFGKILNPGLCIPLWILTGLFTPDLWIIKFPAVVSGLLLVGLSYPLLKRAFDQTIALGTCLLLAASPMAIGYSRIGWDPCQSTLACLLAIAFVYRKDLKPMRRFLFGGLAFAWACIIHPTNIFILPVLMASPAVELTRFARNKFNSSRFAAPIYWFSPKVLMALLMAILFVAASIKAFELIAGGWTSVSSSDLKIYFARLVSRTEWYEFWVQYGRLFSGINLMIYVVGTYSPNTMIAHDLAFWIAYLPVTFVGLILIVRNRRHVELTLFLGYALALIGFEARASSGAMIPALERYSQWLVVPGLIFYVMCLREIADTLRRPKWGTVFIVFVCGLQLWSFQKNYFDDLIRWGGRNHWTFFTGSEEPKRAAFQTIRSDSHGRLSVVIWTEDFWSNEALRFFSHRLKEWVIRSAPPGSELNAKWVEQELNFGQYLVGFQNGPIHMAVQGLPQNYPIHAWTFNAFDGRPILHVWRKK